MTEWCGDSGSGSGRRRHLPAGTGGGLAEADVAPKATSTCLRVLPWQAGLAGVGGAGVKHLIVLYSRYYTSHNTSGRTISATHAAHVSRQQRWDDRPVLNPVNDRGLMMMYRVQYI